MSKHPPPAVDVVGRMAGEYRVGRKLGEGGFGAVYEAEHPLLKRRAAVKVLHQNADRNSDAVLRFVAEAQAVNQIRSRHIVDIFSFGEFEDGRHFYVMDLLEGEPLDKYLARLPRLDVVSALQLLRPIANALDAAHAAGIVHRDLKPQNIFLTWDSNGETVPKLLDFGTAKLLENSTVHTVTGTPVGTPLYMSPEQALGGSVDGRADVYALGVLTHELLTGQRPITGENLVAVLVAHINQPPPRASEACSDVPALLDEPILNMLRKNPEERPATAGAALEALIRAAEASGSVVPPGLPHLERPSPHSEAQAEHPAASFAANTGASGAVARSSHSVRPPRGMRWTIAAVFLVVGSGLSYFVARGPSEPSSPSAGVRAEPPPAEAQSSRTPSPSAASAPAAPVVEALPAPSTSSSVVPAAASGAASSKPKRRSHGGPTPSAIPSDLESPF